MTQREREKLEQIRDIMLLERERLGSDALSFGYNQFSPCQPGSFLLRHSILTGFGQSAFEYVQTGCFRSAAEALGWLRYIGLPLVVWVVGGQRGESEVVDSLHPDLHAGDGLQSTVQALMSQLEAGVVAKSLSAKKVEAIRLAWNKAFCRRGSESELYGLGPVIDVLKAGVFDRWLGYNYGERAGLGGLVDSDRLDLANPEHLALVNDLIEMSNYC